MSTDPVAAYQSALRKCEEATHEAESLVKIVTDAAEALRVWQRTRILNGTVGSFSSEAGLSAKAPAINAQQWPAADRLEAVLLNWHKARKAAKAAWDALPQDRRIGLAAPPELPT